MVAMNALEWSIIESSIAKRLERYFEFERLGSNWRT
jgi:hypothetical protein